MLTLKKGTMYVDEYINVFINKMEFTLPIFLDELEKIDMYANRLRWEYFVLVKHEHTFEAAV